MTMYTPRQLVSNPGLSQEEALLSIQEHPEFTRRSAKVSAIRRRGDRWVITVLEKTAGPFPPEGGESEGPPAPDGPAEDGPPSDDEGGESDGPPSGDDGGGEDGPPKEKGGEKAEIGNLLHLVQQIADALGIVPPDAAGAHGPAGPEGMGPGPDGPPAPPPHGGPDAGMGGPGGLPGGGQPHGTKLKPGEVPNKPGVVPVGAPAFAKVQPKTARLHDPQGQVKIAQAVANFKSDYPNAVISQVRREGSHIRILFT